jgi:hypothetical protein
METLACLPATRPKEQHATQRRNLLNSILKTIATTGLIAVGVATSVVVHADSAAACGTRSRCVTVRPVCRTSCCVRSCGVGSYALPLYFPRSYPAYPTYYRR